MKLLEVFENLTAGELSQLAIGGGESGVVDPSNYGKLLTHINLGLTALYTRFNLKENETSFALVPGTRTYVIPLDDLLKIERVYDALGNEWALNDEGNVLACRTLSTKQLQVPEALAATGGIIRVGYRANHPRIIAEYGYIDPALTEVELPYSHLQALLYFVASRCHNPVGMTNEFHAGNSYMAKYEAECARLEMENLETDQGGQYDRLYANGWV